VLPPLSLFEREGITYPLEVRPNANNREAVLGALPP
jgi:hypothetical protein